jgi:hypothetical protein
VGVVRIYINIGMLHLALSFEGSAKVGNDVRGRADAGIHCQTEWAPIQASGGL